MKTHIRAAGLIIAFIVATAGIAQDHNKQDHTQFNDHDRQVTQDWYKQHQRNAPKGLRSQDRLSAEQEARLQRGRPLDSDLRKHSYSVPTDLRRHLPPAPRGHRYVSIGGHVVLVDGKNVISDFIRINF
ncbi:MAG TPA: RcnB family protein [Thermoanaerobaculia bacterium]|jgi:Ni/Co efflux regulator RcnB|nr:RcnB family protein [Thermoanaerobaculia bacterium]